MRVVGLFGDETALMGRIIGLRQALAQTGAALPEGDQLRKQISDFDGKVDAVRKKSSLRQRAAPSLARNACVSTLTSFTGQS